MPKISREDFAKLRAGMATLQRSSNVAAEDPIDLDRIVVVPSHRAALDPDRSLVIGNRGVGKSYWTRVLSDDAARKHVATFFNELATIDVVVGFNNSRRNSPVAPTKGTLDQAYNRLRDADSLWRAVLLRVARERTIRLPADAPADDFSAQVAWVADNGERTDRSLTALDDLYANQRKKLVVVFDALDHLGSDWRTKRAQTSALLKCALAARSYRAIRLKLFIRRDQFEDPLLFEFPDGSKIANQRVDLVWSASELYTLLFKWLAHAEPSAAAFDRLIAALRINVEGASVEEQKAAIDVIAGEFMGATKKQGRVYTWLPLHLSDARGETSPRTFLTAWREAALFHPAPATRAVDYRGLHEGVRKASADRLEELKEDYWWISQTLEALGGQLVPMERSLLKRLWKNRDTASKILQESQRLPPVNLENARMQNRNLEDALIRDLVSIGIIEERPNDKINIPDIFRLKAQIKRKGGVAQLLRAQRQ